MSIAGGSGASAGGLLRGRSIIRNAWVWVGLHRGHSATAASNFCFSFSCSYMWGTECRSGSAARIPHPSSAPAGKTTLGWATAVAIHAWMLLSTGTSTGSTKKPQPAPPTPSLLLHRAIWMLPSGFSPYSASQPSSYLGVLQQSFQDWPNWHWLHCNAKGAIWQGSLGSGPGKCVTFKWKDQVSSALVTALTE